MKIEPDHQTVDEGSHVKLVCLASGSPVPKIQWLRSSNHEINQEATVINGVLTIPRARLEDTGYYLCRVTHTASDTTASAFLKVTRGNL